MKVVILGAGVIGVSIADALARRGAAVHVIDMRSAGRGASQASAGMLAPYTEAHADPNLLALGTRSLDLFDDFVSGLADAGDRPIEYARTGTLEVAMDEVDVDRLRASKSVLDHLGVSSDLLDRKTLGDYEPTVTDAAVAGLVTPVHGFVAVSSLVAALVHRARFAGAVFESPVEAVVVESGRDAADVEAAGRHYLADAVVIATGSWSRRVRVRHVAALPVRPVRGQLLHLHWNDQRPPSRIVWGPRCYAVPWSDAALLVGATVEDVGFDEHSTVAGVHELMSAVSALLPASRGAYLDEVRVGLRPALPDGLPAIGPVARAPRVVVATGHYRNGVLLAPLTAQIVSRYLLDGIEDPAFAFTSPNRFFA